MFFIYAPSLPELMHASKKDGLVSFGIYQIERRGVYNYFFEVVLQFEGHY
jgi:hypothetical protein